MTYVLQLKDRVYIYSINKKAGMAHITTQPLKGGRAIPRSEMATISEARKHWTDHKKSSLFAA